MLSHEYFFILHWFCSYNSNENYYYFFVIQPLLHLGQLHSYQVYSLCYYISVYHLLKARKWRVNQWRSADMLLSLVFSHQPLRQNTLLLLISDLASLHILSLYSSPKWFHPAFKQRGLLTVFLQRLISTPHPFPLPRSLLYLLTLILLFC